MIAERIRAMRAPHWLALFGLILAAWAVPAGLAQVEAAAKAGRQPGEAIRRAKGEE